MTIYAVMRTGGTEYRVAPGDVVRVDKLEAAPGATVEIREVCLIEDGQDVTVGSPTVAGASVVAEVIEEGRGEKIVTFKKRRRNHYLMTIDDVGSYTVLRIREIVVDKSVYAAKPEPMVPAPPVVTQEDGLVAPQPAFEERADPAPPSSTETPTARVIPLPHVEIAAPAPSLGERPPRKRSYGVPALVVALLVIATGLLVWGGRQTRVSAEAAVQAAPVAAMPHAVQPSLPETAAKPPARRETAIRKPAAASAPSAPIQPPE